MINNSKIISEDDFLASLRIHPRYFDYDGCDDKTMGEDIDFEASISHLREFMGRVLGDSRTACWWKFKAPEWVRRDCHFRSRRESFWELCVFLDAANRLGNEVRFSLVPMEREVPGKKVKRRKNIKSNRSVSGGWAEMPLRSFAIELGDLTEDRMQVTFESATAACTEIGLPFCHFVKCSRSFTFYWSCTDDIPIPLWVKIQRRLVEILGADSSCASPQKEWHMPFMVEWCGVKTEPEPGDDEGDGYFYIESVFTSVPPYSLKSVGAALGIEVDHA